MSDNQFPFGKFDGRVMSGGPDPTLMAVLNGLQQNLMVALQKIEILENKVNAIENKGAV